MSNEERINEFVALTGADPTMATQYLEGNSWDLMAACNSYFVDQDEQAAGGPPATGEEEYTGPRTLDGRPAPQASSNVSTSKAAPKKKGIATLGSVGGGSSHQHDDDDDDDDDDNHDPHDRGNLFAGGEKSGLAVQDPNQQEGSSWKKVVSNIEAKARANASRSDAPAEAGPSAPSHFRGTGMTLGGEGVESRSIPDPLGRPPARATSEVVSRVLHLWRDGFSVDDGELLRFDDPANRRSLQMIQQGHAPLELMNVPYGQPVDVKLEKHDEDYKAPPKKYKPFGGEGRRLGAPVPGDGSEETTPIPAAAPPQATASSSSAPAPIPAVDETQPTLSLRIQLPDGTRLPARFNTTSTIEEVYGFIHSASAETRDRPWVLATTFPNKEHTDKNLVLGEMPEFKKGGTAVVKWT